MKRLPNKVQSAPVIGHLCYAIGDEANWNFTPGQVIWTNTIDTVWMTVYAVGNFISTDNHT